MLWHIFPPLWINLTEVEALLDFRNNLYGLQGGIFSFNDLHSIYGQMF